MARKETPKKTVSKTASKSTPARNTPLPKPQAIRPTTAPAPAPKVVTYEMIQKRAFEISLSGRGDQLSHWLQAERELKGIK